MQKSLSFITLILIITSCSTPKEITKSNEILPNCHCEGNGGYTIVMDAGMGNWSLFYQPIFKELKKKTRVCVIDRPGYAMNIVSSNTREAKTIALEIQKSLQLKGIDDNIILVGHSLGGLHIRLFQAIYPKKVKGMILIDAAHPKQFDRLPKAFHSLLIRQQKSLDKAMKLAQKGYLKYSKGKIPTYGIPEPLLDSYYEVTTSPEYYYTLKSEVSAFENSLKQVEALDDLGDLPLLVIASRNNMEYNILPGRLKNYPFEEHNKIWLELQAELGNLSTNSTFVISDKNHYLHLTDNEMVVRQITEFISKINF